MIGLVLFAIFQTASWHLISHISRSRERSWQCWLNNLEASAKMMASCAVGVLFIPGVATIPKGITFFQALVSDFIFWLILSLIMLPLALAVDYVRYRKRRKKLLP
jgi:hypothetical protein